MKEVKIFLSYASDSEKECDLTKSIIRQETNNHFSEDGYSFNPICWRDIIPGLGQPQEDKIDPEITDPKCRLVVILLKNILGTIRKKESSEKIDSFSENAKEIIKHRKGIFYDENTKHLVVTKDLYVESKDELLQKENMKSYKYIIEKLFQESHETGIEHEYSLAKNLIKETIIYRCDFSIKPSEINTEQVKNVNDFVLKAKTEGLIVESISSLNDLGDKFRSDFARWAKKFIDLSKVISGEDFKRFNKGF